MYFIEHLVFFYFLFAVLYLGFFSLASYFPQKKQAFHIGALPFKIVILIPAYKEDLVIEDNIKSCLSQDYPIDSFDIVLIADSMQASTLERLKQLPIRILEINNEFSTKAFALNKALENLTGYEIAVILDADNIIEAQFLKKINESFHQGCEVVQAHRVPKNNNTDVAVLDGISEEINNTIFRKGHYNIGLSAALIGSGMAFSFDRFKSIMCQIKAVGGFDKELEFSYFSKRIRIHYLDDAYVFDEKTQKIENLSNQRRRWLSAQFYYARKFSLMIEHWLLRFNIDYLNKLYQMFLLPRVLLLGLIPFFALLFVIFFQSPYLKWALLYIILIVSLLFSIPKQMYNKHLIVAIRRLPVVFFVFLLNVFKLKGANKKFIHTTHG